MLGFGELFAHEIAFRLGWSGTKVGDLAYIMCLYFKVIVRRKERTEREGEGELVSLLIGYICRNLKITHNDVNC